MRNIKTLQRLSIPVPVERIEPEGVFDSDGTVMMSKAVYLRFMAEVMNQMAESSGRTVWRAELD